MGSWWRSRRFLKVEGEELAFVDLMRKTQPEVWRLALQAVVEQKRRVVIVSPRSSSLEKRRVTRKQAEAHILVPLKADEGLYGPLFSSAGTVRILGSDLEARGAYYDGRRVPIIGMEALDVEGHELGVILTVRPLAGGIDAPDDDDQLERSQIAGCVALLRADPALEETFRELNSFACHIHASRADLDSIQPSLPAAVFEAWRSACDRLLDNGAARALGDRVPLVVEAYIMRAIHAHAYNWTRKRVADERRVMHASFLDDQLDHDLGNARPLLRAMALARSPLDKLLAMKKIANAVRDAAEPAFRRRNADMTTDDLIDLLIQLCGHRATILAVNLDLVADLRYIAQFHQVETSTSALGFCLANFEVVVDFLLTRGRDYLQAQALAASSI